MTREKIATFYIYLDNVNKSSALKILKKSHYFGATFYPHYIRKSTDGKNYYYSDLKGNHIKCESLLAQVCRKSFSLSWSCIMELL